MIFIWVGRVFLLDFEKESVSGPAIKQKAAGISLSKRCMTMQTLRKVPKNAAQKQRWLLSPVKADGVLSRRRKEQLTSTSTSRTP